MIIDRRPYVTCLCGTQIHAATLFDAWQLFDRHIDARHGRRFPLGAHRVVNTGRGTVHRRSRTPAPLTPQGGES